MCVRDGRRIIWNGKDRGFIGSCQAVEGQGEALLRRQTGPESGRSAALSSTVGR